MKPTYSEEFKKHLSASIKDKLKSMKDGKMTKYRAFIDGGKIALIDQEGTNFSEEINSCHQNGRFLRYIFEGGCAVTSIVGILFFFNYFLPMVPENKLFSALLIVILATGFILIPMHENKSVLKRITKEYNNAKYDLKEEILELEKVLAEHQAQIEAIKLKDGLDFAQNFKKRDSTVAKTLIMGETEK